MDTGPLVLFPARAPDLDRPWLRAFARQLSREAAGGRTFSVLLASSRRLRTLNRDFLGKDYATDVLSFPMSEPGGGLGDIAINVPLAREQAAARGHSPTQEIAILMLHGLLHLLGHDHETDRGRMRRAETAWRKRLGLPAGLIERTGPR